MIDMTEEQVRAVEQIDHLPILVNPKTGEEFVLVRRRCSTGCGSSCSRSAEAGTIQH